MSGPVTEYYNCLDGTLLWAPTFGSKKTKTNWNQLKVNCNQLKVNWNQLKVKWNQLKVNWNQFKVNWNQLKVNWNQLKVNWNQLKVNWNQLKLNWNQLQVNWNQFKVIWNQLKVNWNQLKVNWNQLKVNWNQLKVKLKANWNPYLSWLTKKMLRGGQKKVRVIEYPQIVWGGPHTNQQRTLMYPIPYMSGRSVISTGTKWNMISTYISTNANPCTSSPVLQPTAGKSYRFEAFIPRLSAFQSYPIITRQCRSQNWNSKLKRHWGFEHLSQQMLNHSESW